MAFNAGELVATIRLDGQDAVARGLDQTGQKFTATQRAADAAGRAVSGAFRGASLATGAAAATAVGLTSKIIATGTAYNALQQSSRAAMNTLMGGAKQANAQMDKLDAFAKNSPFSKATFIQAQQQLIGFGVEANKVIPILGAVQDATAAVGGNNETISAIVDIMAKIQSSAKITAEDLNMLGGRGIDAATIIGSEMGKTGAQIRESITKGTLSADDALSALTTGMQSKFDGAASNVKNTYDGMRDRIKAASRDIGAAISEPFVSQQGGGMAVAWGNQVADVLRAVEKQVPAVMAVVEKRGGTAFAGITKQLDAMKVSVKSFDPGRIESFLDGIGDNAPAVAGVAGAVLAMNTGFLKSIPVLGQFVPALAPIPTALAAIALASPEVRSALGDVLASFEPLLPAAVELAGTLSGTLDTALPIVASGLEAVASVAKPVADVLAKIPGPVLLGAAAFLALSRNSGMLGAGLKTASTALQTFRDQMKVQAALGAMGGQAAAAGGAFAVAGTKITGFGNALKGAFLSNPVGLALTGISIAAGLVVGAFASAGEAAQKSKEQIRGLQDTLTETGAATEGTADQLKTNLQEAFDGIKTDGVDDALKSIGANADILSKALAAGGPTLDDYIAQLRKLGEPVEFTNVDGLTIESYDEAARSANSLADSLEGQKAQLAEAAENERVFAAAQREARAAMTESERAAANWATAVGIASDSSNTATERINAMRQALDLLNGGAMSAAEAQRAVDQSARSISEALSETDENGKNLASTLVDSAGAIDTTSEAGDRLYQSFADLQGNADNALSSMVNAAKESGEAWTQADAEGAVQGYVDSIRSAGEAAGMSEKQIQGLIDQFVGDPVEKAFILSFEGSDEAKKKIYDLAQELDMVPSQVSFAVNDDGTVNEARLEVLKLGAQVLDLPSGKSVKIDAPSDGARAELEALGFKVRELPDGRIEVTQTGAETAGNQISAVANRQYNATIMVNTVKNVTENVQRIVDTITKDASANGNLFDGGKAQAFANGGFPTGIYAGRPGAIHKFAEPETGWEAYVSGRPGQEPRNRKILEEAAARLGGVAMFANGGLTGARQGGVTAFAKGGLTDDQKRLLSGVSGIRSSWNQAQRRGENRAAGREGNGLSLVDEVFRLAETSGKRSAASLRRTGLSSERQFLKLEKQSDKAEKAVTRTSAALSKAKDKLADLRSAASSMASSVASAVRRFYDLGTIGAVKTEKVQETRQIGTGRNAYYETREVEKTTKPTASTIKSGMQKSAAAIKKFADTLKKLQKKGYQAGFLAEVAELGVAEGQPVADALLKASTADRNAINSAYKTINSQSNAAGKTVADANYSSLIKKAEAQQKTAQRAADQAKRDAKAVQARMGKETDRLIKAMSRALGSGKGLAFADGGMITAFANGGPRVSQIATGGQNILWAEPETGWEAYISGKPSMRARNIDLMEKVNRRMGSPLTASPAPNITNEGDTMQVNYHAAPSSAPISDEQQLTRLTRRAYAARARMRTRR